MEKKFFIQKNTRCEAKSVNHHGVCSTNFLEFGDLQTTGSRWEKGVSRSETMVVDIVKRDGDLPRKGLQLIKED